MGTSYRPTLAESIVVGREEDSDYVILMMTAIQEDLDNPTLNVAYRTDPEQAREIARRLVRQADIIEGLISDE